MQSPNESPTELVDFLNPLAGWEAASRWNRATFDWMAKGWQQWVALMTTVPPHFVVPPTVEAQALPRRIHTVEAMERAMAKAETPRASRTAAKPRSKKAAGKPRTRG
jgi:hypothetical protein